MMVRLLLIDDDEQLGAPLAAYFRRFEFDLQHATRPSDGLKRLRGGGFDVAILDVMLPKRDGFDVCRTIKQEMGLDATYVVMLTAKGQAYDREEGLAAGADLYMTKPFDPDALLRLAREVLGLGVTSA